MFREWRISGGCGDDLSSTEIDSIAESRHFDNALNGVNRTKASLSMKLSNRSATLVACLTLMAASAHAAEVPYVVPLSFSNNLPKVTATMGDLTVPVRLDSGAYNFGITLSPEDLARAKVRITGTRHWKDAQGNDLQGRVFIVPELRLGNLTVHDVPGTESVFAPGYAPPDRDGMLGFSFLKNYVVLVDFKAAELRLYSSEVPPQCRRHRSPLIVGANGLSSAVRTEFGELHLGWDTAATGTFIKPGSLNIASSAYKVGATHTLRKFGIGDVELGPVIVRTVDLNVPGLDGLLGYAFFQKHVVCLDVPGRTVAVGR